MNWTVFCILLGFAIGNLIGFGLWLHEYICDTHKVEWYKDGKFWLWFLYILVFGTAYVVLRLVLYIRELLKRNKHENV